MLALLPCLLLLALAGEPDRFVAVPFSSIPFDVPPSTTPNSRIRPQSPVLGEGYVVLDGPGEAFLDYPTQDGWQYVSSQPKLLVIHVSGAGEIRGRVFLPASEPDSYRAHTFTLAPAESAPEAKDTFYEVMERRYQRLLDSQAEGAAWFRHRIAEARAARGLSPSPRAARTISSASGRAEFEDTFDLFTGGRALAENLDLERGLLDLKDEAPTVDITGITGVTTRAMDWKRLIQGLDPELDPLAGFIPEDQYAAFFPSLSVMTRVIDELDAAGSPLVAFAATSIHDQRTKERYQDQLCLPLSGLSNLLGPAVISSIAITGSDPFLPSGSDLAVLFASPQPATLEGYLAMLHVEALARGASPSSGEVFGVRYTGVRSNDRRISSYLARLGDTILVTNSPVQLRRIVSAHAGTEPALKRADEYVWFRERYRRGAAEESAFLVLTDAAIRSWVGPRVRIAESRRVRAAAAMVEIQARHFDALVEGRIAVGASAADASIPQSSDFVWTANGVNSPTWGNLQFLTPIAELEIGKATGSEKRAYEVFRRGFESRWRTFFDPIALRLSISDQGLAADMTVMPLVAGSDYSEMIDLAGEESIAADGGGVHGDTLFHIATAVSKYSEQYQWLSETLAQALGVGGGSDPLEWIGECIALYADRDPIWEELKAPGAFERVLQQGLGRLPIALHVEVCDPALLAGFLAGVRSWFENLAPNWTRWESLDWNERGYMKIHLDLQWSNLPPALYYVALPDALVLSFREDVVQRAIDRDIARRAGKLDAKAPRPWLGESVAMSADRDALIVLERLWAMDREEASRRAAWLALPILNEWKRRYPTEDPVRLHERTWGVRLVSPGGGTFVWNDAMQTMEASDYGSPASPKPGSTLTDTLAQFGLAEFGLAFEHGGLRARVKVSRE